jgi:soluble lytic murein transglycosylase-like protein
MRRLLICLAFAISACGQGYAAAADAESRYYADAYADHYGIPRLLVYAVIEQESEWNRMAVSNKGALGLMQLMPRTARRYGVHNPFSKPDNIGGGVRYLKALIDRFHGDLRLAIAAYYTGEDRVHRRGLNLSNPQVVAYVEQVRQRYARELRLRIAAPSEGQR